MPIYEYRCAACGFEHEYLQKVSDPLLTDCPQCGKATFTKLVSASGFQLKGSGWYVTDFKNNGTKPAPQKTKAAAADTPAADGDQVKSSEPEKAAEKKAEEKKAGAPTGTSAPAT